MIYWREKERQRGERNRNLERRALHPRARQRRVRRKVQEEPPEEKGKEEAARKDKTKREEVESGVKSELEERGQMAKRLREGTEEDASVEQPRERHRSGHGVHDQCSERQERESATRATRRRSTS